MNPLSLIMFLVLAGFFLQLRSQPHIELELYITGLESPVGIAHAGKADLFVIEQRGKIKRVDEDGVLSETPFLDISQKVSQSGFETGLLGLAFHPDYMQNGLFYVYYTRASDGASVVSRFTADPEETGLADFGSELIMLTIPQPFGNHNGGQLLFGPDGYLYVTLGDGGSGGDPQNNGQELSVMMGKILRLDVNADNDSGYVIPAPNPFIDTDNVPSEIWAYGLRNPWRNSFDRETGDLWIADVGQNAFEEINFQPSGSSGGENYGWRCFEGNMPYNTTDCGAAADYVFPVYEYPHEGSGCSGSVTGGFVYRGATFNALYGSYIFADYCTGKMYSVNPVEDGFEGAHLATFGQAQITAFGEDIYGELYVVFQQTGEIYKLIETGECSPAAKIIGGDAARVFGPGTSLSLHAVFHPELSYQWFKNDEPIPGEMYQELEITSEGSYRLEVTEPVLGCSSISNPVEVFLATSSVDIGKSAQIIVYPNPATDILHIEGVPGAAKAEVVLFDSIGKALIKRSVSGAYSVPLTTHDFPSGIYYLQVRTHEDVFTQKIIINGPLHR